MRYEYQERETVYLKPNACEKTRLGVSQIKSPKRSQHPTISSSFSRSSAVCSFHRCSISAAIERQTVSASPYFAHNTHANPLPARWHLTTNTFRIKNFLRLGCRPFVSMITSHALF